MRDAGDELPDCRELLRLEQLRLCRLEPFDGREQTPVRPSELVAHLAQPPRALHLAGHVLRDLHDGGAFRGVVYRARCHAENPLGRARDFLVDAGAAGGAADGTGGERPAAQANVVARETAQLGHRAAHVDGQRGVSTQQPAVAIEHRDRIADRIERRLPFLLAGAHERVQTRVLHADRRLVGNYAEHPFVFRSEAIHRRTADAQDADQIVPREHGDAQRGAQRLP